MLAVVGMGAMMTVLAASAHAAADPDPGPGVDGSNCETDQLGTLFCDGPVKADGTWTRCMTTQPQILDRRAIVPSIHRCQDYGSDNPPGTGQPPEHIGDDR